MVCSACEPKRRRAAGRAMGRLPVGASGKRERDPELFARYYAEELARL